MFHAPLKHAIFRQAWLAVLFSNMGTWIHSVTASLLMTTLTDSAVLIGLIQTAVMLPLFLLSIPAGVVADLYKRKNLIIGAHIFMALIAMMMALTTFFGYMSAGKLLACLFLLNAGLAFNQPAWQAVSSLLVPPVDVRQAAVLNNLSYNFSRCIGPALAGFWFASLGPAFLFLLNSISFLGVIFVFWRFQRDNVLPEAPRPTRRFSSSLMQGIRCLYEDALFRHIVLKSFCFFLPASMLFAILPYLVVIHLRMSESHLGLLMTFAGIGAISCAFTLCHLRKVLHETQLTTLAFLLVGIAMLLCPHISWFVLWVPVVMLFGYAWSMGVSVFNGMLQAEFPEHLRARLIGVYTVFFAAAQAVGGYLSGTLTAHVGVTHALSLIGLGMLSMTLFYCLPGFKLKIARMRVI